MCAKIISRDDQLRKWGRYKELSAGVAKRLMSLKNPRMIARGELMSDCARNIAWAVCPDCGTAKIYNAYLCRDRLCPTCAWRLAMRRYAEMIQVFEATGIGLGDMNVAMLTVTVKNVGIDKLKDTISDMLAAWSKLMKRRPVRKLLLGWARSLEITNIGRGYHPHIHALLIMPQGEFIDQREWAQMWRESLDVDYTPITDIRLSYDNGKVERPRAAESGFDISARISAAVETLKCSVDIHLEIDRTVQFEAVNDVSASAAAKAMEYSFKPKMLSGIPQRELERFALAIKDRRLVSFGGIIAETRRELKLKDDDLPSSSDIDVPLCPQCGADCAEIVYEWANGGYSKRD